MEGWLLTAPEKDANPAKGKFIKQMWQALLMRQELCTKLEHNPKQDRTLALRESTFLILTGLQEGTIKLH